MGAARRKVVDDLRGHTHELDGHRYPETCLECQRIVALGNFLAREKSRDKAVQTYTDIASRKKED